MDEDMNTSELLVEESKQSRTQEILRIIEACEREGKPIGEIKEKIEALLRK